MPRVVVSSDITELLLVAVCETVLTVLVMFVLVVRPLLVAIVDKVVIVAEFSSTVFLTSLNTEVSTFVDNPDNAERAFAWFSVVALSCTTSDQAYELSPF